MSYRLSDIARVNEETMNNLYPYEEILYLDTASVTEGKFENVQKIKLNDAPSRAKRIVKDNDILISTVRPNLKHYGFVEHAEGNLIASTGFAVISPKKVVPKYLYYFLTTKKVTKYLSAIAENQTSTFPAFNPDTLENLSIELPSEHAQKQIAKILGDLDRKIELNRRMNETLEQIGQALFKKYFVDNPERENWEDAHLSEFVELVNGASYKSSELSESEYALVTLKSFKRGGGFKRDGFKEFTGKIKDNQVVKDGDLVVAHTDVTQQAEVAGVPALVSGSDVYGKVGISMDIVKVMPKTELLNEGFLYFLMMTREFQAHKMGYVVGTTVLHLNKKCIPEFAFKVPDLKTLSIPSKLFQEIIYKKTLLDNEIVTLEKVRDLVLPKLMSGEIEV